MRILVIGGTRFMGRDLVERLVAGGHDVSVLHRQAGHDLGDDVGNLQADRNDLDAVGRLLGTHDFEAVFDFAYDWDNGTTAEHVAGAARSCTDALQRYVFMSSIAVYGGGTDAREDEPLAPDDHYNPYVRHKATTERALFRMHEETGFPVVTFRPPFVHGPRQPFYREQFFWDRMLDDRPIILPDGGATPMEWAFAPDVADACVRALEVPAAAGEAFNVAHAEPTTQRTFVEALARAAGVVPTLVSMSRAAIRAAGGNPFTRRLYFGEVLDVPAHGSVIDKAARVLGFTPTPLDAALRTTFEWYVTQPRRAVDYTFEDRLLAAA
jgi:2'-hydroxyisoflavone reductase